MTTDLSLTAHGARVAEGDLRHFAGEPTAFWPAFLGRLAGLSGAPAVALWTGPPWRQKLAWPATDFLPAGGGSEVQALCVEAARDGSALKRYPAGRTWIHLAALRLAMAEGEGVALLRFDGLPDAEAVVGAQRASGATALPLSYELRRQAERSAADRQRFAEVLDLLVLLNAHTHFAAAAMLVCNELAARFHAERVSLGWLEGRCVRLKAMSHVEKFAKKMGAVRALEIALEEALDQDEEIAWPAEEGTRLITRAHAAYAQAAGAVHLASVPLRLGNDAPIGVLGLERAARPFSAEELVDLRLAADQVVRRLADLHARDRWFGARWLSAAKQSAARFLGPEHTLAKLLALAGAVALAILFFGKGTYSVQAPFSLHCDALAQLPAPFDGYINEVQFRIGDHVAPGQPLLSLDARDLLVQKSAALSEYHRHLAEAQKAESAQNIAEMRIARAAGDEAHARLDLAEHRLEQARILAPFDGYVIEGDLREKIAAPVRQGEVLLKVARIEAIYPEVEVPERSVQEIAEGAPGVLAFASRPGVRIPIVVERIEPAASLAAGSNVFVVRCRFAGAPENWWRPGMSGVARLEAGRRTWFWIFTHRTVDYLRLRFWW